MNGHHNVVKLFTETFNRRLTLHDLATRGTLDQFEAIFSLAGIYPDINCVNEHNFTLLHMVAGRGWVQMISKLLDERAANPNIPIPPMLRTALHVAITFEQNQVIERLMQHPEIHLNQKDAQGRTPLHAAACNGNAAAIQQLVACEGVNVNSADDDGLTPLHCAVSPKPWHKTVEILVAAGADINAKGRGGWTPLQLAVEAKSVEMV